MSNRPSVIAASSPWGVTLRGSTARAGFAAVLAGVAVLGGCSGTLRSGNPDRHSAAVEPIAWPARDIESAKTVSAARVVPVGMGVIRVNPGPPSSPWTDRSTGETYRFVTYCERVELRQCRREADGEDPGEGSRIALSMPKGGPPRAILLFLPGMAGARPRALMDWAAGHELAFLEVKTSAMDTPGRPLEIRSTVDLPAAAAELAADVDQRLAETAYAAEGALGFFESERVEIRGLPVVVVGASAGALSTPAVVARLGDRVAAAVLMGGGSDICRISLRSSMSRKLLPIVWGPHTSYLDEARLDALYRERTKLDPLVLAPALGGIPILNLYASLDSLVPTEACEELQDRLGQPDSVRYPGGHMFMFLLLREDSAVLANWIEGHLPKPIVPTG